MAPVQQHVFTSTITCHAWNKDRSMFAMCPNTKEIQIWDSKDANPKNWTLKHTLTEHDLVVCGLDWSPVTNQIVSCSHDRNAFVWTLDEKTNTWTPSLVILRINRAALSVKWNSEGTKFAVGSGAKVVPVCHFEENNDWWISKQIKKHKSTVISVDWHPNNQLIATGSSDMKCRVFSAFIPEVDGEMVPGPFETMQPFGTLMAEFDSSNGWVEAVCWSGSGQKLAFVGHDASVTVITFDGASGHSEQVLRTKYLPLMCLTFNSEEKIICAGHDMNPMLFEEKGGSWDLTKMLDEKEQAAAGPKKTGFANSRALFEAKSNQGTSNTTSAASSIKTKHEGAITCITSTGTNKFSTTGLDGRVVLWTF